MEADCKGNISPNRLYLFNLNDKEYGRGCRNRNKNTMSSSVRQTVTKKTSSIEKDILPTENVTVNVDNHCVKDKNKIENGVTSSANSSGDMSGANSSSRSSSGSRSIDECNEKMVQKYTSNIADNGKIDNDSECSSICTSIASTNVNDSNRNDRNNSTNGNDTANILILRKMVRPTAMVFKVSNKNNVIFNVINGQ